MAKSEGHAEVDSITIQFERDQDPDVSWLTDSGRWTNKKDEASDRKRLAEFENGDWHMVGVIAVAELNVDGTVQEIRSGGVWGVESDANKAHLASHAKEEYDDLVAQLRILGVKKIPAFKSARWVRNDY